MKGTMNKSIRIIEISPSFVKKGECKVIDAIENVFKFCLPLSHVGK